MLQRFIWGPNAEHRVQVCIMFMEQSRSVVAQVLGLRFGTAVCLVGGKKVVI